MLENTPDLVVNGRFRAGKAAERQSESSETQQPHPPRELDDCELAAARGRGWVSFLVDQFEWGILGHPCVCRTLSCAAPESSPAPVSATFDVLEKK